MTPAQGRQLRRLLTVGAVSPETAVDWRAKMPAKAGEDPRDPQGVLALSTRAPTPTLDITILNPLQRGNYVDSIVRDPDAPQRRRVYWLTSAGLQAAKAQQRIIDADAGEAVR